ncbi:MAG: hypothetical protein ABII22_02085 [Candidatus Micrarchaeota archaeon]
MNALADYYVQSQGVTQLTEAIEPALLRSIESYEHNGSIGVVAKLLERRDLSDAVRRAGEEKIAGLKTPQERVTTYIRQVRDACLPAATGSFEQPKATTPVKTGKTRRPA